MGIEVRRRLRTLETHLYARVLHRGAAAPAGRIGWDPAALRGHRYCLLASFRRDGRAVPTPVWFAPTDEGRGIVIRSGASDGKVKRIRRDGAVLVAPCTFSGRPLGPAMEGSARVLSVAEQPAAEDALRRALGLQRRLYSLVRDPSLEAAYIEVVERGRDDAEGEREVEDRPR